MIFKPFAFIFGGIGIIPLLVALGFGINTMLFISQAQVADGVVIEAAPPGSNYKSVASIQFTTPNGQVVLFTSSVRTSPPEFRQGQQVKVYYKPADPSGSAQADSFISLWFFSGLCGIIGLAFFGVGVGFAIPWRLTVRKINWLYLHGQRVNAIVAGVRIDRSVKKMGESPYFILAEWRGPDNFPYLFKSEKVWKLPEFASRVGNPVEVLIDPQNPRRYFVEIMPGK